MLSKFIAVSKERKSELQETADEAQWIKRADRKPPESLQHNQALPFNQEYQMKS